MSQQKRLLTHGIALIVAMFLWLNPFCLLPELDTVGHHSEPSSAQDHSSHPKVLCNDHLLHAVGTGHDADISAKAGISVRLPSPAELSLHQHSVATARDLEVAPLPAPLSVPLPPSKPLYSLHSVYLI